jgi:hypothetical protein
LYLNTFGSTGVVIGMTVALLDDLFDVDVDDGLGLAARLVLLVGVVCQGIAFGLALRDRRHRRSAADPTASADSGRS